MWLPCALQNVWQLSGTDLLPATDTVKTKVRAALARSLAVETAEVTDVNLTQATGTASPGKIVSPADALRIPVQFQCRAHRVGRCIALDTARPILIP